MYKLVDISLPIDFDKGNLSEIVSKKTGLDRGKLTNVKLMRLSLDARNKSDIKYVATIVFDTNQKFNYKKIKKLELYTPKTIPQRKWNGGDKKVVIVGSGPSGLFAGLTLAEAGLQVTILERGYEMEKRKRAVRNMMENGVLDPKSNIQFGEGGAGTFSDGKLNSGIKSEYISRVLETFHRFGANENILYDSRPHIGTDILSSVIVNIRHHLESLGSRVLFEHTFNKAIMKDNKLYAIEVSTPSGDITIQCDILILAIGHSSRDTIRALYNDGIELKAKPFSMGFRIEHLREDINRWQYGEMANREILPTADYHLSEKLPNGRVIYTFCMCPGGVVVPAMSEEGTIVTNGMSYNSRMETNSNSALLINVNPEDFGGTHPLDGIKLQEKYEKYAYSKAGGYRATVQVVGDFLNGVQTTKLGRVKPSFTPDFQLGSVEDMLPDFIISSLKMGIPLLDRKLHGFADSEAILTGVETRSSAPYQIIRRDDMQSSIDNIYMIGEGAGFAGGIVSSAVEGIKVAIKLLEKYDFVSK